MKNALNFHDLRHVLHENMPEKLELTIIQQTTVFVNIQVSDDTDSDNDEVDTIRTTFQANKIVYEKALKF